ncbi:relaxase/mobilization nuclease domain-containing protein [Pedobacter kyungheensis]|uniref:relaxase/mobilization nuclease domain-containing protein n=1 Tax=Pedobacter kyungheensis TaxID=1069985 RepID=UPI00068D50BD|nr:relaxase/mobilization nuclease domain-containing protein [Pedobacter kyungheensis]
MVARIVTGKKVAGIVRYNEDKVSRGEALLLMGSGFAAEVSALSTPMKINRFLNLTRLNAAVKTNALHISLNFHRKDSIDEYRLCMIAREYMEGIGFGNQPYLVYQHMDVHHPHIHIVSTNIRPDGSRIDVHGIGYRLSEPVRKTIEQKYELIVAQGRTEKQQIEKVAIPRQVIYGQKATRKSLSRLVRAVREHYVYGSFAEFNMILKSFNVIALPGTAGSRMEQCKGLLYAVLNDQEQPTGVPIKASALSGQPILRHLEKDFELKGELKKSLRAGVKEKIDQQLARGVSSFNQFQQRLFTVNIEMVVARSTEGKVFGISYIDHGSKTIFKGSALGKDYAATALMARFGRGLAATSGAHRDKYPAFTQHVGNAADGTTLTADMAFLLEPVREPALVSVGKRKKKKRRSMEREQGR